MELKIDKDVAIPTGSQNANGVNRKYPFPSMEVGDSFFAPGRKPCQMSGPVSVYRKKGKEFTSRTTEEGGVKGTRIWRIK